MAGLRDALHDRGLLARVTLSPEVEALLEGLQPAQPVGAGDDVHGTATLGLVASPLGFLSLNLTPLTPSVPFHLVSDPAAGGFRLWLVLSDAAPAKPLFGFATGLAGSVLTPAVVTSAEGQEWLEPAAGEVRLTGVAVALLVEGAGGTAATLRIVPGDGATGGMVMLGLEPSAVLLGSSGLGFELPEGLTIDASSDAAAPGTTTIDGNEIETEADDPAWQGLVARRARFFLPRSIGRLGGHAVDAWIAVGTDPAGVDLAIRTCWTPTDGGPAVDVLIECRDPSARGLQDVIPTLVEAWMTLPVAETQRQVGGAALAVIAGSPVIARVRFARAAADPTTRLTLGLESQGPEGILTVRAPEGGVPARAVIGAGALATAIVADDPPPGSDASGAGLHALLVVATALSSMLKDEGQLTVNAIELASEGGGVPVGGALRLEVDYSVAVVVIPIRVGVLLVSMRDEQPMRVRNRHVVLTYDPARDGLDRFRLDFSRADMEIEDPGGWTVEGPGSLFDVLGSRSGRGSTWLEVDLRFKVNLGPVEVSGATIRATRADDGSISASLRGLAASLEVPGVLSGSGAFMLEPGGSFGAHLDVALVPLNLAAGATLIYRPADGGFFLQLAVDLPGPIPVANTGIGLFGVAGSFGYSVRPARPPAGHPDPVGFQLAWDSSLPQSWEGSPGDLTVGAELVIGTLPDLGFSFSTKGGIFLTAPDLAIRGALWGTVLSPRMRVTERPSGGDAGLSFRGVVVVDSRDGVTIGLEGRLVVPVLLEARVPLGAHFPTGGDTSQWFINIGADGYRNPARVDGRASGPIRVTVLPDLIPQHADAYVMLQGHGMDKWPRGEAGSLTIADGFVLAFGFGFSYTLGVKPVVWADVHARLDVLLATRPLTLAGFGNVGGSLNLGPFSIGVDADLRFLVAENADPYVHARLCGRIDLFFTEIEGCVEISIHSQPSRVVPPPDVHPLDDMENGQVVGDQAHLIDDQYRRLRPMARTAAEALEPDNRVWPDTLLHLGFGRSPWLAAGFSGGQFPAIEMYPSGLAAQPVGSSMLSYDWDLTGLSLSDVTDDPDGPGTLVAGELSGAWQLGKDGDPGVRPQAGDLVLLTYQGDLWLNRLADGGAGLPDDPIGAPGRLCEDEPDRGPTWVVGWGARGAGGHFELPPDPVHPDPRLAPWTANARLTWSKFPDEPLSTLTSDKLPPGHRYRPPFFTPGAIELPDRSFDGILDLGGVDGPQGQMAANAATIRPSEAITGGRLWLAFPGSIAGSAKGSCSRSGTTCAGTGGLPTRSSWTTVGSPGSTCPTTTGRWAPSTSRGAWVSRSGCSGSGVSARPRSGHGRPAATPGRSWPVYSSRPRRPSHSRPAPPPARAPAACWSPIGCTGSTWRWPGPGDCSSRTRTARGPRSPTSPTRPPTARQAARTPAPRGRSTSPRRPSPAPGPWCPSRAWGPTSPSSTCGRTRSTPTCWPGTSRATPPRRASPSGSATTRCRRTSPSPTWPVLRRRTVTTCGSAFAAWMRPARRATRSSRSPRWSPWPPRTSCDPPTGCASRPRSGRRARCRGRAPRSRRSSHWSRRRGTRCSSTCRAPAASRTDACPGPRSARPGGAARARWSRHSGSGRRRRRPPETSW